MRSEIKDLFSLLWENTVSRDMLDIALIPIEAFDTQRLSCPQAACRWALNSSLYCRMA